MSKRVITFGEIMLRLAPNGYYRFFKNDQMVIWLLNGRIMNSAFFDGVEQLFGENTEMISRIFIHFNKLFLAIIIFALAINCIETVVKSVKYGRK